MKKFIGLILVFSLALALRIPGLANYPPGFTPDEAAFGYNAYSLLKTGRDEWGVPFYKLPLTNLESFGDYKLPLYAFLAIPTVKIFGLNEFATRLPNALIGSLAVIVIYVLTKKIWPKSAQNAALLLSISPWGIQLSRGAFEANLVTLLLPLTLILMAKKLYFFSSLFLALNFYSYHSARFLSLLLIPLFLYKSKKYHLFILFIPGLIALFSSGGSRSTDVSILSPTDNWRSVADRRFEASQTGLPDSLSRFFSNKITYSVSQFTHNYLSYFSPEFLFTDGPKESTYGMIPGTGVFYLFETFTLLTALIYLIKNPKKQSFYFLLFAILFSVVPAALAKGPGMAANRAVPMLPFLIIFSALGLSILSKYLPKILLIFIGSLSLLFFLEAYKYHNGSVYSGMLFGRKEAFGRVAKLSRDYNHIFVSKSLSEPHIYLAFYHQTDPNLYQKNSVDWQAYKAKNLKFLDQYDGYSLGKYTFGSLTFSQPNSLYIGLPQDFPSSIKPMFTIDYPNGTPAITVSRL